MHTTHEATTVRFSGELIERAVQMDSRNKSASDDFILIHILTVIAVLVTAIHDHPLSRRPVQPHVP